MSQDKILYLIDSHGFGFLKIMMKTGRWNQQQSENYVKKSLYQCTKYGEGLDLLNTLILLINQFYNQPTNQPTY